MEIESPIRIRNMFREKSSLSTRDYICWKLVSTNRIMLDLSELSFTKKKTIIRFLGKSFILIEIDDYIRLIRFEVIRSIGASEIVVKYFELLL